MAVQVTSGEFVRDVGYWPNEALLQPVEITHHGKVKLRLSAPGAEEGLSAEHQDRQESS
ncbi:MAG: hypothetical protein H7175_04725 [Burkholderiales bacterium]|nr:hypothetical protein [Anaerolineae bacterium]